MRDHETINEDDREALDALRSLRSVIESSGNRQAVDAYNNAIRVLKARDGRNAMATVDAYMRGMRDSSERDFGEQARKYHRREIKIHGEPEEAQPPGRATDSVVEDWAEAMNATGRKMREK